MSVVNDSPALLPVLNKLVDAVDMTLVDTAYDPLGGVIGGGQ